MPAHFKRLCSVIDKLPLHIDFSVPQKPEGSGLSQDLESHHLSDLTGPESLPRESNSQQSISDAGDSTPDTLLTGQGAPKRPEKDLLQDSSTEEQAFTSV
jgi:hypothetical protein